MQSPLMPSSENGAQKNIKQFVYSQHVEAKAHKSVWDNLSYATAILVSNELHACMSRLIVYESRLGPFGNAQCIDVTRAFEKSLRVVTFHLPPLIEDMNSAKVAQVVDAALIPQLRVQMLQHFISAACAPATR